MAGDDATISGDFNRDPVERLAEEFLRRRRQGEPASITEYAEKHPELAGRIRDLFPTLLLMEELKPGPDCSAGGKADAEDEGTGRRLGDFRILREVGRGGMGVVYEAEQESLGRRVALKVLPKACVVSATRLRRFLREAQAAARLHHTNIVPIFGVGRQDETYYYVMQFIAGQGLDQVLGALRRQTGPIPTLELTADSASGEWVRPRANGEESETPAPARASSGANGVSYWHAVTRVGIQAAEALEYAHAQGILHRDIKPSNLLLDGNGIVWVADFGLAKLAEMDDLTHSGDMVGTLRYMAPEQFEGLADARSDVYSLGLTLYELLTLRAAFEQKEHRGLLSHAGSEPPRPRKINRAIPLDLETIVVKAMAEDPGHRYQTAGELADDLRCYLEDRPIRARRLSPWGRLWRWCRRNRAVAALSGLAAALLVAVAVVASIGYFHTQHALARAEAERARTRAEHERAEANLRLASKAFEDIFRKLAPDPSAPAPQQDEQASLPEPASEPVFSQRDAALLESLLHFYQQFADRNKLDVKLRQDTAAAYRRVGDIQRRLGQYDKAETAYKAALESLRGLGEEAGDAGAPVLTAAVYNELGVLLRYTGRFPEARSAHEEALETLLSHGAAKGGSPESRFELARSYSFLSATPPGRPSQRGPAGGPRRWSRSPPEWNREAVDNSRRAVEILGQLTKEFPDEPRYRLAMARTLRYRWMIAGMSGDQEEALQSRLEAARLLQELVEEEPQNPEYRYELVETYVAFAPRGLREAPVPGAVEQTRLAVKLAEELVLRYPNVPEYKSSLARAHASLAEALQAAGELAESKTHARRAVELELELVKEFPAVIGYHFLLMRATDQLADVQEASGELAEARKTLEEGLAAAKKLQEGTHPIPPLRMMLARQYRHLARVLRQLGQAAPADAADQAAEELGPGR